MSSYSTSYSEVAPSGTMKAFTHTSSGHAPAVLRLSHNLPIPKITNPTDVLVKISYASLDPGASMLIKIIPMIFRTKPSIPETDFSGIVVATGHAVSVSRGLTSGAEVWGSAPISGMILHGRGALAEYIVVPADRVVLKPAEMAWEQAAGLPVVGSVTLSVMGLARVQRGEKVLVNGASGGIGSCVVQMAKQAVGDEGRVIAICSGKNRDLVTGLGADEVIDYQEYAPIWKYLGRRFGADPFDVILDCRGVQELFTHCPTYLREGKPLVSVGSSPLVYDFSGIWYVIRSMISNILWPRRLGGVNRPYLAARGLPDLKDLERTLGLFEGGLRVPIDSIWDLEDAAKAYEVALSRRAKGKVIVKM